MEWTTLFLLSVIQGVTEFLPISSSGHLLVLPYLIGKNNAGLVLDIALHLGTLLAVLLYFKQEVAHLLKGMKDTIFRKKTTERYLFVSLLISVIPIVVIGGFLGVYIEHYTRSLAVVGAASIFFGVVLMLSDQRPIYKKNVSWKDAFVLGLFQVLALIPGTSRSGICMTAGRFLGLGRLESTRYGFLMAMPTLFVAGVYSAFGGLRSEINWQTEPFVLLIGICLSFMSALLCIHLFIKWIEKIGFLPFVIYRLFLGCVLLYYAF